MECTAHEEMDEDGGGDDEQETFPDGDLHQDFTAADQLL
jgi:hypothetical protein